jgi:outer membrane protein OmpA-like peptidoglycan-associated protein
VKELVLLLLVGALGCAGANQRARSEAVGEVIEAARKSGAQQCAPVQLAMAESHRDFADQELSEGNFFRAREELDIAEKSAGEALRLSPKGQCTSATKVAATDDADSDGDGISNEVDDCPRRPEDIDGYADADGCPELDNDLDGFFDKVDECPDEAEDKDGFEDDDGCPDNDNDADGLADRIDECPEQAEDKDGHDDDDGCPDCAAQTADGCPQKYQNVVITKTRIELKQTVFFETGRTKIRQISFQLLDEVAQALTDNPTIHVRIEGHTDSRGGERRNLRLSQGRAAAVRAYLVSRGVAGERMIAKGYGESMPLADNRTARGRAQNRRVEFVITNR